MLHINNAGLHIFNQCVDEITCHDELVSGHISSSLLYLIGHHGVCVDFNEQRWES